MATAISVLTDRKAFMIISGGVNIYPQEIENLIVTHPRVADVAVIGAPDDDMGEKVVAIVQPMVWERRRAGAARRALGLRAEESQPHQGAETDRLYRGVAAAGDGQTLQAAAARPVLGKDLAHRVRASLNERQSDTNDLILRSLRSKRLEG